MTVLTCSIEKDEIDKLDLKEGRCFSFFTTQELKNRKVVPLDLSVVLMHELSNYMPHLLNSNQLELLFKMDYHTKHIETIFDRVLSE